MLKTNQEAKVLEPISEVLKMLVTSAYALRKMIILKSWMMLDMESATTIILVKLVCLLMDFVLKNQRNQARQVSSSAKLMKRRMRCLVRTMLSVV